MEGRGENVVIRLSRLPFVDDLPRLVEMLHGKEVTGEVLVQGHLIRCKAYALPRDLRGFFILSLFGEDYAEIVIRRDFPRVARNGLLIRLGCFVKFSTDRRIVAGGDLPPFPLAGMFPSLEGFGHVLAGSRWLGGGVAENG